MNCTLSEADASVCCAHTHDRCRTCGWEAAEKQRRVDAIRAGGAKLDKATGKYCLKIRKEQRDG